MQVTSHYPALGAIITFFKSQGDIIVLGFIIDRVTLNFYKGSKAILSCIIQAKNVNYKWDFEHENGILTRKNWMCIKNL